VWTSAIEAPLYLVGGGSGIAPLMSMLRHRQRQHARGPASLLYSSRSLEDVIYRDEIDDMTGRDHELRLVYTLTREQPPGWSGPRRRIDEALLAETGFPPAERPAIFVCGPTPFVERAAQLLVDLGHDPLSIRTERFGPSGG
jgi:ferredoxin-NADP reductase